MLGSIVCTAEEGHEGVPISCCGKGPLPVLDLCCCERGMRPTVPEETMSSVVSMSSCLSMVCDSTKGHVDVIVSVAT